MELSALKRDRAMLLAVLGIDSAGQHLKCPFHAEATGSLAVWQGREDGVWLWKCHAGCGTGTIIDAAMKQYRCGTPREAFAALERELGVKIGCDEDLQDTIIDLERAEKFIAEAHNLLMNSFRIQETYLIGKRGISNLDVIRKYRVGFVEHAGFAGKSWSITGWVLPITDAGGSVMAVKLHTEVRPWPDGPKCLFAPFGTHPAEKPRHGVYTLWPPPEDFTGCESLYLCPGELKAIAEIASGACATAPTSGENKFPDRFAERILKCKPGRIFVPFDDDEPKATPAGMRSAGREWKDSVSDAFKKKGVAVYPFAYGAPGPTTAAAPGDGFDELDAELQGPRAPEGVESESDPIRAELIAELDGYVQDGHWLNPACTNRDIAVLIEMVKREALQTC